MLESVIPRGMTTILIPVFRTSDIFTKTEDRTMPKKGDLTPKQRRFVDEFMVDYNATRAYIRAGYAVNGRSAEANASRLMANAKVRKAIEERDRKLELETFMTAAFVRMELMKQYHKLCEGIENDEVKLSVGTLKVMAQINGMLGGDESTSKPRVLFNINTKADK